MKYYIAYGSNMNVDQMTRRCPDAKPIGGAILTDWCLTFKVHATIEPKKGFKVPVVVWEISDEDERRLDEYEGFPGYYHKKHLDVWVNLWGRKGTRNVNAMVYIMNNVRRVEPPTVGYYNGIEEGYEHFKFDKRILRKALDDSIYYYALEGRLV